MCTIYTTIKLFVYARLTYNTEKTWISITALSLFGGVVAGICLPITLAILLNLWMYDNEPFNPFKQNEERLKSFWDIF